MTKLRRYEEIGGAAGAGCVATLLGHPLDTIKTHLQTQSTPSATNNQSAWQIATSLRGGLWRGMGPPLGNAILMNTVMFSVFEGLKERCAGRSGANSEHPLVSSSLWAGVGSGFATACISTPTDYVKIQAQLSSSGSSLAIVRHTFATNPLVLYRGHVANLVREGLFTMVYLGLYDQARPQGFGEVAVTSAGTGALAWVASYPADTVKTVCQAQHVSIREAMRQVWARQDGRGIRNFYQGCGASTGRAILVTTSRMIVYEWILGRFQHERS
jgi:hypothetical protein